MNCETIYNLLLLKLNYVTWKLWNEIDDEIRLEMWAYIGQQVNNQMDIPKQAIIDQVYFNHG